MGYILRQNTARRNTDRHGERERPELRTSDLIREAQVAHAPRAAPIRCGVFFSLSASQVGI
jgi:hypothetical protein